jgi:hypothetical protein
VLQNLGRPGFAPGDQVKGYTNFVFVFFPFENKTFKKA